MKRKQTPRGPNAFFGSEKPDVKVRGITDTRIKWRFEAKSRRAWTFTLRSFGCQQMLRSRFCFVIHTIIFFNKRWLYEGQIVCKGAEATEGC